MKTKLLICGATGFIGRNLAEHFISQQQYDVYGIYLKSVPFKCQGLTWIKADLTSNEQVDMAVKGMDMIVQAAATTSGVKETFQKPYYHVTDNAIINSLVFRAAHIHQVKQVVFFSCTVMYQSSPTPLKETDFDANKALVEQYFGVGWTKVYIEKMCEFYSRLGNTKYTVIRHSNIYGPHDKYDLERSHVFGATMTKVALVPAGGNITVWGTGEEGRDLLYVDDLTEFVQLALERQQKPFELVNVGLGKITTITELVQKIINHFKKDVSIKYDTSKPTMKTSLCLNTTKAKEVFGWAPKTSIDQGIEKTLQWYQSNIDVNQLGSVSKP